MKDWAEKFGAWLRHWRAACGYSQLELGKLAGVTKGYISNLERSEPSSYTGEPTRPTIEVLYALAGALKRPRREARELVYGVEPEIPQDTERAITVEEALRYMRFFDRKELSEKAIETLRPLLEMMDREIDRLTRERSKPPSRPAHRASKDKEALSNPKITNSPPQKRDWIDEALDTALPLGGKPLSDKAKEQIRKILEEEKHRFIKD